ncbi:MAG: hypothetical protein HYV93_14305 [Candidatus Rokubacteria bacterium]|nr:hypothetical protein [Candidatus Rokubacteria bacterium]
MTTLLTILGVAALFALFGLLMRGRRLSCGGSSCTATAEGCGGCDAKPGGETESTHAQR